MATKKGIYKVKAENGNYDIIHLQTDASQVIESISKRFVTDSEKATWNGKANASHVHKSSDISDATNTNTANTIIKRDTNGDFSARIITASLSGNSTTATKLQTARTINGIVFDGTSNITMKADPNEHNHDDAYAAKTHNHDSTYLKLNGGKVTGDLSVEKADPIVTIKNTNSADVSIVLDRGNNANWRMRNTSENLIFESDYDSAKTDYYSALTLNCNSGNLSAKGKIFSEGNSEVYHTGRKPTASDVGASPSNHSHNLLIANPTAIGANKNLNDYKTAGVYYQDANANATLDLNYPEARAGSLTVYKSAGVTQVYRCYNSSTTYTRSQYDTSAWTTWAKEYNTLNKPSLNDIGAAASVHKHTSSDIDKMTGYVKATTVTAIGVADTLNVAMGKLEKAIDEKQATHSHPYRPDNWVPAWNDVTSKPSTFNPSAHNHLSSEINKLTGYIKGTLSSAIVSDDSLNIALGKLEVGLDNKSDTHTHPYRPTSWVPAWVDVTAKPTFHLVATSGSYNDLDNKPTIHTINDASTTSTTNTWSAKKVNDGLAGKAASSHTHTNAQVTGLGTASVANTGTGSGQVPVLDSKGKLLTAILPSMAINETFTAADEAAALKLVVENGDIVIITAGAKTCICVDATKTVFTEKFRPLISTADSVSKGEFDDAMKNKVDKVSGKALSTNDFTAAHKTKVDGIATGANNYVHPTKHAPSDISTDSNNRFVTDTQKTAWDGKAAGTHTHTDYSLTSHDHESKYFRKDTANSVDVRFAPADFRGIRFWDADTYKIYMAAQTHVEGGRLDTASDYNMYFKMGGGASRGFVFKNDKTVIAHLDGTGVLRTKGEMYIGANRVYHQGFKPSISDIGAAASSHTHSNYLATTGDSTITGKIIVGGSNRDGGMYGTYDSAKTQSIWSIGTSYRNDAAGANFGNLYGLAYKHTNNTTGGTMAGGHQMVWCSSGVAKSAMGENGIWTAGTVNGANVTVGGNNVYHTGRKPTASDVGAAASVHSHTNYMEKKVTNGAMRVYNQVCSYENSASVVTGILKIVLPKSWTSTMLSFTLNGYDYSSRGAYSIKLSGYNYSANPSAWTNCTAIIDGKPNSISVRFGYDGSRCCVLIGATNTTWAYPKFFVTDVMTGHSNPDGWDTGWSMAFITSETGLTSMISASTTNINSHSHAVLTRGSYLTGSNYDGSANQTWSVDGEKTATANKVAVRDGSGDISVRLLRSEYANQTSISGAMAFRINNSSDNYIRYCSDTNAIRTFLSVYAKADTYTKGEMDGRYVQKTNVVFSDSISITTPAT